MYQSYGGGNRLLDRLPSGERSALIGSLHVINVEFHGSATTADESVDHVVFPIDAIFSVLASFEDGSGVEVGTVGSESFLPVEASAGARTAARSALCQVPGRAALLHRTTFERALGTHPVFAALVRRNVCARVFTTEQLAGCNLIHTVLQRSARWLLTTRDRVARDEFPLTHDFLAMMLGVRRPSVSEAAAQLQRNDAIRYRRGKIAVVDAERLLASSCECYALANTELNAALDGKREEQPA